MILKMNEVIMLFIAMILKNDWGKHALTAMILKNEWGNYALTVKRFWKMNEVIMHLLLLWSLQLQLEHFGVICHFMMFYPFATAAVSISTVVGDWRHWLARHAAFLEKAAALEAQFCGLDFVGQYPHLDIIYITITITESHISNHQSFSTRNRTLLVVLRRMACSIVLCFNVSLDGASGLATKSSLHSRFWPRKKNIT
jgi:hypothetical protein